MQTITYRPWRNIKKQSLQTWAKPSLGTKTGFCVLDQKKNCISWCVKTLWYSNIHAHKYSFIGTQPSSFIYMSSLAASVTHWQSWVVATETVLPAKPNIFAIWLFLLTSNMKNWEAFRFRAKSVAHISSRTLGSLSSPQWQPNIFLAFHQPSDSWYQLARILSAGSWFLGSAVFPPQKAQSIF